MAAKGSWKLGFVMNSEVALGLLWCCSGTVLGLLGCSGASVAALALLWDCFGPALDLLCRYSGAGLGLLWRVCLLQCQYLIHWLDKSSAPPCVGFASVASNSGMYRPYALLQYCCLWFQRMHLKYSTSPVENVFRLNVFTMS